MNTADLTKAGIGLAVALAAAHFIKSQPVKAACYGVAGVIVASRVPYLNAAVNPDAA
jgi:hypothetical protein